MRAADFEAAIDGWIGDFADMKLRTEEAEADGTAFRERAERAEADAKTLREALKYLLSELPDQLDGMRSACEARATLAQLTGGALQPNTTAAVPATPEASAESPSPAP